MKCLYCGMVSNNYLCDAHVTEPVLDEIFNIFRFNNAIICENKFIRDYARKFEKPSQARACLPEIFVLFPDSIRDYYLCRYYWTTRDTRYEETVLNYLSTCTGTDEKWQRVLWEYLDYWIQDDFVKPQKWCEIIKNNDNLAIELYYQAAKFFGMVGDYDFADEVINKAIIYCNDMAFNNFLLASREDARASLLSLIGINNNYKIKPYWPTTMARRTKLIPIYEAKGIPIPITVFAPKKKKVIESDFKSIEECDESIHSDYCAFWCADVYNAFSTAKVMYQIAAVKVRGDRIVDEYQSFVKIWDGKAMKEAAAKEAGVDIAVLDKAPAVSVVMNKFFKFVGDDILVSTSALGNQAKIISRAARYSNMTSIPNKFFDLLDYAADVSPKFDMVNNSREHLLSHFQIQEGNDALEKAKGNVVIYLLLKKEAQ